MRIVGVVVALGLVALGCSSERASTVDTEAADTTLAPTNAPSDTATSNRRGGDTVTNRAATTTTTTLPAGSMGAKVPNTDVRFAVPELYTELNPTELGPDFYQSKSFSDLAARVDTDPETFQTALRENLDLFFFAPAEAAGLIGQISVDTRPDGALPAIDELRLELKALGAVESVKPITVDGVQTLQSRYVGAATTGDPVFAYNVIVRSGGALVDITAKTVKRDETDDLAKLITETLRIDT